MKKEPLFHPLNVVMIALGTAIYAFGFVHFNMANHLAEGGFSGITLIIKNMIGLNPAYSSLILNLPLFVIGMQVFGKRDLVYTIYGTIMLSVFLWIWQEVPFDIDINHDMLIAALLAGIFNGIGLGLVFRYGGTTGGSDIIARLGEKYRGIQIGQTLFIFDIFVLFASLSYVSVQQMMYTLIASFVVSQVMTIVQTGGYTVRGMLIITQHPKRIADAIMEQTERGATYLKGEGAYSGNAKDILYVVLNPRELIIVKDILAELDPTAFVSIINVHEVIGSGFTWAIEKAKQKKIRF